jgi:hypothetical protein
MQDWLNDTFFRLRLVEASRICDRFENRPQILPECRHCFGRDFAPRIRSGDAFA